MTSPHVGFGNTCIGLSSSVSCTGVGWHFAFMVIKSVVVRAQDCADNWQLPITRQSRRGMCSMFIEGIFDKKLFFKQFQ
jgi:hypothetical protein